MAKSYTEELAAWVERKAAKKRRLDATAVQFLTVKSDVKCALDAGYSVTTIWEHMHETKKVTCTYETFRKHVKRFVKEPPGPTSPVTTGEATGTTARKHSETPQKSGPPKKIGGFKFDATPKKEDLI